MTTALDTASGLHIPQARIGFKRIKAKGIGHITYVCHSCGGMIVKPYEVFFVDWRPGHEWASSLTPAHPTPTTTTHHDWHMASQQGD